MYKELINAITHIANTYSQINDGSMNDYERHYVLEGLSVAIQAIEHIEEVNLEECPYETLEETLLFLKDALDYYDVKDLVDEIYEMEDEELEKD